MTPPLPGPVPALARGRRLRNTRPLGISWTLSHCLIQVPDDMTRTTLCLCLMKASVHFLPFFKATFNSGGGPSRRDGIWKPGLVAETQDPVVVLLSDG